MDDKFSVTRKKILLIFYFKKSINFLFVSCLYSLCFW